MRVLVCGSRNFNDYSRLEKELWNYEPHKWTCLISGGAKGADTLGELFARSISLSIERFPANWDEYGKRAGSIRNYQMLKEGKPDLVIAFIAQESRGTKHMVEIAKKAGIPVKEINI